MSATAFRALLEDGDVPGLMAAWGELMPGMPQPTDYHSAEVTMHLARTATDSLPLKPRAYSHRWLLERDLPSQLPDNLKPSAERLYPVAVAAVGISLNTRNKFIRPALVEVRGAMEYAVLEAEADGLLEDDQHVRTRMTEAKQRTFRALFGR